MKSTLWNKVLRVTMALVTTVSITLVSCGQPSGGGQSPPPPPPGGPQFVINSPQDGTQIAGPTFFSVQPLNPSEVESVRLEVDGRELKPDFPGEDMFKVFLIPSDFPAGDLTLKATVTGKDGKTSSRTVTVSNVPDPPSQATVGARGAVLGTTEANGAVSTLTIPPGVAQGTTVSFEARTQEQIKASTGVDYDALGVTFLGAQEINSDRPLEQALMVSSGGFGPAVQPGQAVVQYMIAPDGDGDGIGELIVVNTASIAPNGDVISDPVPQILLGSAEITTSARTSTIQTLQAGISGPPGTAIEVEATGFNPASAFGNIAVYRSSVDGTEAKVPAHVQPKSNSSLQALFTSIPLLPPGPATLTLRNASTGSSIGPINVTIEPQIYGPDLAADLQIVNAALNLAIAAASSLPTDVQLGQLQTSLVNHLTQFQTLIQQDGTNPTPEQRQLLAEFAALIRNGNVIPKLTTSQVDLLSHCTDTQSLLALASGLGFLGVMTVQIGSAYAAATAAAVVAPAVAAGLLAVAAGITLAVAVDCFSHPFRPPPSPGSGGGGGSGWRPSSGMGSAPPPGGNGFGDVFGGGTNSSSLHTLQTGPFSMEPGRYIIRVLLRDLPLAFSGTTDAAGYFFIPMIPDGEPFTAVAIDRQTGETRTFEGVGRPVGQSVYMFFDFLSGEGPVIPKLSFNTNTEGTLSGLAEFLFDADAGQVVTVASMIDRPPNDPNNTVNATVRLYDPDDILVSRIGCYHGSGGDGYYYNASCPLRLPKTGSYRIELQASVLDPLPYTLGLALTEDPTPVNLASPVSEISGNISVLGDWQYYHFSGSADDLLNLLLDQSESPLDLRVLVRRYDPAREFFDPGTGTVAGAQTSPSQRAVESGRFALPQTGDYLIEVMANWPSGQRLPKGGFQGAYTLTLVNPQPRNITLDSNTPSMLEIYFFDEFTFQGTAGEVLNMALLNPDRMSLVATIYGPDGQYLTGRSAGGAYLETGLFRLTQSGTYRIVVDPFGTSSGDYTLGLALIEPPTALNVSTLPLNIPGELTVVGDHQFYSFSGNQGEVRNFILNHASGTLNAALRLLQDTATEFWNGTYHRGASTTSTRRTHQTGNFTLPATATYILELRPAGFDSNALGVYDITIETP